MRPFSLFLSVSLFGMSQCGTSVLEGEKRDIPPLMPVPIIYPWGALHKLVFGIAVRMSLPPTMNIVCIVNLQFQYAQLNNLTQIDGGLPPTIPLTRQRRSGDLQTEHTLTYSAIESLMNRHGFNGHACMLRSICENAMHSFHQEENGLYGQLLDIVLTPDFQDDVTEVEMEYIEARKAGEFGVDCFTLYPDCPEGQGLLELISEVQEDGFYNHI